MSDTKLQKPLISIITVNYNEKNIERTLKSIVTQTFQDFEWIIIDGGSNPETLSIINKSKNRINILISEKDDGVYDAMNKGIKISGGSWLIFMNAGDSFYENTSLEKIFSKYITAIQQKDIIYCDSIYHTIDNIKYKPVFPDKLDSKFWYESCISHQSSFIKRELFEKYGLYDKTYKISADLEKWLLFKQKKCKFYHIKEIVSNYYTDGISSVNESREYERKLILNKYGIKKPKPGIKRQMQEFISKITCSH